MLFLLLLFLLAALHSVRLPSKPDTSALKQVLALPWRPSPCGPGRVSSFSARGEMRIGGGVRRPSIQPTFLPVATSGRRRGHVAATLMLTAAATFRPPPPSRSRIQVRAAGREAAV